MVVNPDGSESITLVGAVVDDNLPIWSPDRTKLYGFETGSDPSNSVIVYEDRSATRPIVLQNVNDGTWQRRAD